MKSSIEWLEDADNAAAEEKATVADLTLHLNGLNVTQHLNEGAVDDHVTVALYGLAHGIAHDWWKIFGARDEDVSLLRYRNGYLLPDLRFRFDGAAFEVAVHQKVYEGPDVRFWGGKAEVMTRREGEALLTTLVETILARLEQKGVVDTSAALRWRRVQLSRHSQESEFCEAAGSMGFDPYQVDEQPASFIEAAEGLFGQEALVEFVSGAGNVDREALIAWVERMAKFQGFRYRLADLKGVADAAAPHAVARPKERAWAAGYRGARAVRKIMDLKQSDRFESFHQFAKAFGSSASFGLAPAVDGIGALRRDHVNGVHVHVRNHGESAEARASHLFTLARGVGDAVCFPNSGLSPINRLRQASRQASARAFAAEFLAPIDEIRSMLADKRDVVTIADEFAVNATVIERQIENQYRIDTACLQAA